MRAFASAALIVLAFVAGSRAADPKASIKGPTRVAAGSTIVLDGRGAVSDRPVRWKQFAGPSVAILALTPSDGPKDSVALAFPTAEGTYIFVQVARGIPAGSVELDADATMFAVTVGSVPPPTPPPNPGPTPTPDPPVPPPPTPDPTSTAPLAVVLVVDTNAMTPALGAISDSPTIAGALAPFDAHWHRFAASSPVVKANNYAPYVALAGGPPALVVIETTATPRVVTQAKCPGTEAEVVAMVRKIRGK